MITVLQADFFPPPNQGGHSHCMLSCLQGNYAILGYIYFVILPVPVQQREPLWICFSESQHVKHVSQVAWRDIWQQRGCSGDTLNQCLDLPPTVCPAVFGKTRSDEDAWELLGRYDSRCTVRHRINCLVRAENVLVACCPVSPLIT